MSNNLDQKPNLFPRFRLRTLVYFTTGMCVLFALLGALGIGALHLVFGFVLFTAQAIVTALLIEGWKRMTRQRPGTDYVHIEHRDYVNPFEPEDDSTGDNPFAE